MPLLLKTVTLHLLVSPPTYSHSFYEHLPPTIISFLGLIVPHFSVIPRHFPTILFPLVPFCVLFHHACGKGRVTLAVVFTFLLILLRANMVLWVGGG